jgi:hypothetical protein
MKAALARVSDLKRDNPLSEFGPPHSLASVRGLSLSGMSGRRLMEGRDAEPFNADD